MKLLMQINVVSDSTETPLEGAIKNSKNTSMWKCNSECYQISGNADISYISR